MNAVRYLTDASRAEAVERLRAELVRRFPGVVPPPSTPHSRHTRSPLHDAAFAWVEVALGQGGLAWLAAWTLLRLHDDPLGRPALWVDTHGTFTPGDLLDLQGRLVVVRPDDPHEAHVAADIALRTGSFCVVALEMHRALHPTPLARLARLAHARHGEGVTQVLVWGEPPDFVGPPSGIPRTTFGEAVGALFDALAHAHASPPVVPRPEPPLEHAPLVHAPLVHEGAPDAPSRTPHATDRLRPLDRAADRRPPPPAPRDPGRDVDGPPPLFPFLSRPVEPSIERAGARAREPSRQRQA